MPMSNRLVGSFVYLSFIRILLVNIGHELFQCLSRPALTLVEVICLLICPLIYM